MNIVLSTGGAPPAEQIHDQIRGLIAIGALSTGVRLPSVRQLAADLGVAPGTVAKAYRQLEAEGLLTTRIGAGTTVSAAAESAPSDVADAARTFITVAQRAGLSADEAMSLLRAMW